jgi:hypothetical protein
MEIAVAAAKAVAMASEEKRILPPCGGWIEVAVGWR